MRMQLTGQFTASLAWDWNRPSTGRLFVRFPPISVFFYILVRVIDLWQHFILFHPACSHEHLADLHPPPYIYNLLIAVHTCVFTLDSVYNRECRQRHDAHFYLIQSVGKSFLRFFANECEPCLFKYSLPCFIRSFEVHGMKLVDAKGKKT